MAAKGLFLETRTGLWEHSANTTGFHISRLQSRGTCSLTPISQACFQVLLIRKRKSCRTEAFGVSGLLTGSGWARLCHRWQAGWQAVPGVQRPAKRHLCHPQRERANERASHCLPGGHSPPAPRRLPQSCASPAAHHVELPRAVCRCSRTHSGTRERNSRSGCGPTLPAGSLISSGPEVHVGQSRESAIPSWDRRPSQNGSIPFDDTLSHF